MVENLEDNLRTHNTLMKVQALPLETYIARFTSKYRNESLFRANVHRYMRLSKKQRFRLSVEKKLMPSRYMRETGALIAEYAKNARDNALEYYKAIEEKKAAQKAQQELEAVNLELEKMKLDRERTLNEYSAIQGKRDEENRRIQAEFQQKQNQENEQNRLKLEAVENRTNAEKIAQQRIQDYLKKSNLVTVKEDGQDSFNDDALIKTLENRVLGEVVGDIEKETSKTGFIARTKREYDALISHYGEMEDWSELPDVDWVDSAINARRRGYRVPRRMDHFIVGKYSRKLVRGRISLDSALAIDLSGSMGGAKFTAAQKVGWSLSALMRKLNPNNKKYMSRFNDDIQDITSLDLMRNVSPQGYTRTDLALSWGLEKLKDSSLAMFYLLTDGYPEPQSAYTASLSIAQQFKQYPNIRLRIFYVGNSEDSKSMIREIGKAAGSSAKISVVDVNKLASGIIMDFEDGIRQMSSMDNF